MTTRFSTALIFAMFLGGCRITGSPTDTTSDSILPKHAASHYSSITVSSKDTVPTKNTVSTKNNAPEKNHPALTLSDSGSREVSKRENTTAEVSKNPVKLASAALTLEKDEEVRLNNSSTIQLTSLQKNSPALTLDSILESVSRCYPEIKIAFNQLDAADGKILASEGAFDQKISAHTISQPLGFYQTYRNGVGLEQPLFGGGNVYGNYRIGDGNFEPWYGERETNEGGELKAGFSLPLVKNRDIDQRRTNLFVNQSKREQLAQNIEARKILFERMATQSYWSWVAAGRAVEVQQRLLNLAKQRVNQVERRVQEGDLAEIAKIDNKRFIAKRTNTLIKAKRNLQKAAIKLSMYFRNSNCEPVVPQDTLLPKMDLPTNQLTTNRVAEDINIAINSRPEVAELDAKRRQASVELRYAHNLTLPKVDFKGFAGQDLGARASSKGDKSPFELNLGILAEMPVQRREGFGKIQSARAKIQEIDSKQSFVQDKIRAEVQDAASAVNAAYQQILQSKKNLDLTEESLRLGKLAFREGDIDLISLNIYETSVADAELQLLDARFRYQFYYSIYKTAVSGSILGR